MLRKAMFLSLALALALTAGAASAQTECSIGVFADEAGLSTAVTPVRDFGETFVTFTVYYVIRAEDFLNAVAWDREILGLGTTFSTVYSEDYGNLLIDQQADGYGWRLGLGGCRIGFGTALPLLREEITFFDDYSGAGGEIVVTPNTIEDYPSGSGVTATKPLYADCQAVKHECDPGAPLVITSVVASESQSWGSIKALYK